MYEYEIVDVENLLSGVQKQLFNELGKEDWQFVCATDKYAYFWRYKKEDKTEQTAHALDMDMIENMVNNEYERAFLEE